MLSNTLLSPDVRDHSGNVCAWAKMLGFSLSFFFFFEKRRLHICNWDCGSLNLHTTCGSLWHVLGDILHCSLSSVDAFLPLQTRAPSRP